MNPSLSDVLCIRWVDLEKDRGRLLTYGRSNRINSTSELRRAAGIADPRRRDAFVASRIALRLILKRERDVDWLGKEFAITVNGKPYLDCVPLHFSLSRSGDLAVVALFNRPVGIDVERNRSLPKSMRSALDKALGECGTGGASDSNAASELSPWTRLEALVKLRDGRLAERFSAWSDGASRMARNGRARTSQLPYPSANQEDAVTIAVPAPRGYTCTCCVDSLVAPVDVAQFEMP